MDARLDDGAIVVAVHMERIEPGDVDLRVRGDVLQIRGKADLTMGLACDVGIPFKPAIDHLESAYRDGALETRVPIATREKVETTLDSIAVVA